MKQIIRIMSLFMAFLFIMALLPVPALADEAEQLTIEDTAIELTVGSDTTEERAMAVCRYITRYFRYDYDLYHAVLAKGITHYTPDPLRTLNARRGVCYDLAVLYTALLHSQGISVKVVNGYLGVYHAWNSMYDAENDRWVGLDVTMDLRRGRRRRERREIGHALYTVKSEALYE
jgi:transglutaminase-like putative cysteine protease